MTWAMLIKSFPFHLYVKTFLLYEAHKWNLIAPRTITVIGILLQCFLRFVLQFRCDLFQKRWFAMHMS